MSILLPEKLFSYFKFIGDHGDGLSVLDHVVEKGPRPSQPRFKVGLTSQVPPPFRQHSDEIISFEVTIFTKYFVDYHLITSLSLASMCVGFLIFLYPRETLLFERLRLFLSLFTSLTTWSR